jgi:hypothetical protein
MRVFIDRQRKQMQLVIPGINYGEYASFEVYRGIMSPLENDSEAVLIKETSPAMFVFINFNYSYFQTGNIYLIGVMADGVKKLISAKPITAGTEFSPMYDQALRGLNIRKGWYKSLRSEKANIFFKSLSRDCSCWDNDFSVANPNCTVCGGTGRISGYVGKEFDVMIFNDFKKVKTLSPEGRKMSVDGLEAWVFEFPFVNDECILERRNGDRYTINDVSYKNFGGQLIEMSFNLIMLSDSFDYKFELLGV